MSQEKPSRDYLRDPNYSWFCGTAISQFYQDMYLWEVFFSTCHMRHLIELGTWHGGFSTFLAVQCYARRIGFDTFDTLDMPSCFNGPLQTVLGLKEHFHKGSIFEQNFELVKNIIETSPRPFTLFCDNGDKPREFKLFAPFLKSGDYVVVHDWKTEFKPTDIVYDNVEQILVEQTDDLRSLTIFMKVK